MRDTHKLFFSFHCQLSSQVW